LPSVIRGIEKQPNHPIQPIGLALRGRDLHIQISGETMSEVTDLTVIEIKPEQAPVLYVAGGLDAYSSKSARQ
jgi:hypothetical protein